MIKMEAFYKNGLRFECSRCSVCCGGGSPRVVYLSKRDLLELCKFFNMTSESFVSKYCRQITYYYGAIVLALKEQKNHDCILWQNGCTAYKARPLQCSTYPFWTWMIEDKSLWDECASECKGMNRGRLWSREEIEELSKRYSENLPLTIEEFEKLSKP